jgi:hypothetical protein
VVLQKRQGAETDQGGAKMSIDTGKKKDLGSSQTIAQWFAPEIQGRIWSLKKSIPSDANSFS